MTAYGGQRCPRDKDLLEPGLSFGHGTIWLHGERSGPDRPLGPDDQWCGSKTSSGSSDDRRFCRG